jgi:hypothetical protein
MPTAADAMDAAILEVTHARARISRIKARQVRGIDEIALLKSVCHAWFQTHRPVVVASFGKPDLSPVDDAYKTVLNATSRHAAKTTYLAALKETKTALVMARNELLIVPNPESLTQDDLAPDFSPLVGNPEMLRILERRWEECRRCERVGAHLAAIVMMGGLLEALFVARANKMPDKAPLLAAKSAPMDRSTGKALDYQKWTLDAYISVAHELGWITQSARQVADVLKEYRNYIHPAKELRHQIVLAHNDSSIFWQVTKSLVRQLLLSVPMPIRQA